MIEDKITLNRSILKWSLIGLLARLLIMPFSFHGNDIFYVYYMPFKFVQDGVWDPYSFSWANLPGQYPYYPPLTFLIHSLFIFLFKPFLPQLHNLFIAYESQVNSISPNTVQYASLFGDFDLFRTLFIFKLPYLIFDFLIGWFLFQILKSDSRKAILAYILWMLNPFLLHNYALGQFDVITAFFIMAAVYMVFKNKPVYACGLLSLGMLTKTFPLFLVPFAILILAKTLGKRFKLSLAAALPACLLIMPFYLTSQGVILKSLFFSEGGMHYQRLIFLILGYLAIVWIFCFARNKEQPKLNLVILSFACVLLLYFSVYIVHIRHFVILTPFLIYLGVSYRKFWVYCVILTASLFELRAAGNTLQWGLFSALYPEFFSSLPISDSFVNLLINVKHVHQVMYRLFVFSGLAMVIHICLIGIRQLEPFFGVGINDAKK